MGIEKPKFNREKIDWDYAREVRALMKKGKDFHQACDLILNKLGITDFNSRNSWKKRIGKICGEISGEARKKPEPPEEKTAPQEPYEDAFARAGRQRHKKELEANPLFAGQVEEEIKAEEGRH